MHHPFILYTLDAISLQIIIIIIIIIIIKLMLERLFASGSRVRFQLQIVR